MKILFTEDEIAMSEAVVDILTYHKYIVDAVYNGEDAYGYASTEKYDGIILDIMMPKMDGLEVLTKLREQSINTPMCYDSCRKVKTMYNKNYDNNPNT